MRFALQLGIVAGSNARPWHAHLTPTAANKWHIIQCSMAAFSVALWFAPLCSSLRYILKVHTYIHTYICTYTYFHARFMAWAAPAHRWAWHVVSVNKMAHENPKNAFPLKNATAIGLWSHWCIQLWSESAQKHRPFALTFKSTEKMNDFANNKALIEKEVILCNIR